MTSLIFFDGVCGLCNHFVDFVFRHDQKRVFQVASLQGQTAAKMLSASDVQDLNSVVLIQNGKTYRKSEAVLRVIIGFGGVFKFAGMFLVVPVGLRDRLYSIVAHNRYQMFGKSNSCRVPTEDERARFLS